MINIAFITNSVKRCGPVNVIYDIIENLNRVHFNPIVITLATISDFTKQDSREEEFKNLGIRVIKLNIEYIRLELMSKVIAKKIDKILIEELIDIVHLHGCHPVIIGQYLSVPTVVTLHNISGEDYVLSKGRLLGNYMNYRYLKALDKCVYLVAISSLVKKYYLNKRRLKSSVSTIFNGISESNFKISSDSQSQLRTKLSLPQDGIILLCVGSLSFRKNSLYVIENFIKLQKEYSNVFLIFLGQGELDASCRNLAKSCAHVFFKGFVVDVQSYISASDFLVSASCSEGFGLNIVEAMFCNTPVIVSDIPPHREIVEIISEKCNHIFPLNDNALYAVLSSIIADWDSKEEHPGLRPKAIQYFSSKVMSTKYEQIYDQVYKNCGDNVCIQE